MSQLKKKPDKVLEGHRLQANLLRHDLLSLYSLFAAMKDGLLSVAMIRKEAIEAGEEPARSDPFGSLYNDFFEAEVTRLLIQSAITLRMMDDQARLELDNPRFAVGEIHFGGLTKPLSLREACNKVIHLERLIFDYQDFHVSKLFDKRIFKGLRAPQQQMRLEGTHNQKAWIVTLHVGTYVRHAALAAQLYGEAMSAAEMRSRFQAERGDSWTNVVLLHQGKHSDLWNYVKYFGEQEKG